MKTLTFLPHADWTPSVTDLLATMAAHALETPASFIKISDERNLYHTVQYLVQEECRRRQEPTPQDVAKSPRDRFGSPSLHIDRSGIDVFSRSGVEVAGDVLRQMPGRFFIPAQPWKPSIGDLHRLGFGLRNYAASLEPDSSGTWDNEDMALVTLHWLLHHGPEPVDHVVPHDPRHCACKVAFDGELSLGSLDDE